MKIELELLLCIIFCSLTQVLGKTSSSTCSSQRTCSDCIRTHPDCTWCLQEDFDLDGSTRCDDVANIGRKCSEDSIYYPTQSMKKTRHLDLTQKGGHVGELVRLAPQNVEIRLRPQTSFSLAVDFIQAEDFPVDVVVLLDLSNSMRDHQQKIAELSESLTSELINITTNVRLGFGSFAGKSHDKMKQPCTDCSVLDALLKHMPLSNMFRSFEQEVLAAHFSENLDDSDGGFDAIKQAIACKQYIGWRQISRKILVFISDKVPRYAGDGKDGRSSVPNDGYCHLDYREFDAENPLQEYLSINQMKQIIQQNKINIIFAVPQDQVPAYESLKQNFEGSSVVDLESNPSNLLELIRTLYDEITSNVEMRDSSRNRDLQVTYFSKCIGGQREKKTNRCTGLKTWSKVTFTVKIELKTCPTKSQDWNQTFAIYPVGIPDSLNVRLEMICDCECERPRYKEIRSRKCSGMGDYICGACVCDSLRHGRSCECEGDRKDVNERSCYYGDEKLPCSGRGTCVCGACNCMKRQNPEEIIFGMFCEVDNFSCDRFDGKLCGGPERGICRSGCICNHGWTGVDCGCFDSDAPCVAPDNGKICSGNGDCVCGKCKCYDNSHGRYSGMFCETCPTCPTKCEEYKNCVECQIFPGDSSIPPEECYSCPFISIAVNKVEVNESEQLCTVKDNIGCKFTFKYVERSERPAVFVEKTKECPKPWSVIKVVLGTMAGVFLVALLLYFLV